MIKNDTLIFKSFGKVFKILTEIEFEIFFINLHDKNV